MATSSSTHTLYHFPFSICSLMVRYAIALRGEARDPSQAIPIHEESVDIINGEQLTEHFLCDINANGEVPVLVAPHGQRTIPDSVEITHYLAQSYPALSPEAHQEDIRGLIAELHEINFFSLTFTGKPQGPKASISRLQAKLDESPTERYRNAIKHKIERLESSKLDGLKPENVQQAIGRTEKLMQKTADLLRQSRTSWLLGTNEPTAFDAHFIVFVARLLDVNRANLLPDTVRKYADTAMSQTAFKDMMQERWTMPPAYFNQPKPAEP